MPIVNYEGLKNQVDKFRHSSSFSPGDPGSFIVPIIKGAIELPGKYDPAAYLDRLELKSTSNIAVIYPGNGGLCAEAIHRGATTVWAVEPRNQFNKSLCSLNTFMLNAGKLGFSLLTSLEITPVDGIFDVVVWPEGLEQVNDPAYALKCALSMLKIGGRLFIEVVHGQQEIPQGKINSWRPKEEAFVKLLQLLFADAPLRAMKGRLDRRFIYEITKIAPKVTESPPQSEIVKKYEEEVSEHGADFEITEDKVETAAKEEPQQELPAQLPQNVVDIVDKKPARVKKQKLLKKASDKEN